MKKRLVIFGPIVCILAIILLTCSDPTSTNNPPSISSLTAIPDSVEVNGASELICVAGDPDNDNLTYSWEASAGNISGSGLNITWNAPNSIGTYSVSCTVDDGNGGQDIETINIIVISMNAPPNITSLTANPDSIFVNQLSTLVCLADDPDNDNLNYNWQASAGTITGTGVTVTWNAPSSAGTYTITCQVDDGNGGLDSASINIVVEEDPIPQGFIAYWPFNGNANDESGNGNNGTVFGAILATDRFGNNNSAYDFDGIDDYINIGNNVKPNFPISVSAWVKVENLIINGAIFRSDQWNPTAFYHGFYVVFTPDGRVGSGVGSGFASGNTRRQFGTVDSVLTIGNWHHVVVVFTAPSDQRVFVDGLNRSGTYGGSGTTMTYSSADGAIGNRYTDWPDGILDDILIYNRSLTETEIQSLYHQGGWGK